MSDWPTFDSPEFLSQHIQDTLAFYEQCGRS